MKTVQTNHPTYSPPPSNTPPIHTIDISLIAPNSTPPIEPEQPQPDPEPEPQSQPQPAQKEPVLTEPIHPIPNPLTIAHHVFKYEPCEMDVINRWKSAPNDIVPLMSMIQQLCFFSDCNKRCLRTYALHKEDIVKYIEKIRRRPHLKIYTSDINTNDHPMMVCMYRRLKTMIGMFHTNDFMVRVEHAFDNSQITSEHWVVSQLMKHGNHVFGIDPEHHIVVPVCVQLGGINKIPEDVRTLFHHISYSIQPVVVNSYTLDTWFRRDYPINELLMKMCEQMAKALTYLHACGIVHGDVKPGNTLIHFPHQSDDDCNDCNDYDDCNDDDDCNQDDHGAPPDPVLYVIDYGMSGAPNESEGTGGTKPFCAPETGNGYDLSIDMDTYSWTKNKKPQDVWSFALMFFTMMALRKCLSYQKDYPNDFFNSQGHINSAYFGFIKHVAMRSLFQRALCPVEDRVTAAQFLHEITAINANATIKKS